MENYTKKQDQKKRFLKILKNGIKTHKQFKEEYENMFSRKIAQSTIAEYFKEFHIIKGKDGIYYLDDSDNISDIVSLYCTNVGNIHSDSYQFVVKCDIGKEKELCAVLIEKFRTKHQIMIPAYGSIMIVCKSEKNAKHIKKYLKRYCIRKNNNDLES